MPQVIYVVGTRCHPDDEAKFNKWYDEVRSPLLLKFKGLKRVTRYKAVYEPMECSKYLAILEFNSQQNSEAFEKSSELATARTEMAETWKERPFEMI